MINCRLGKRRKGGKREISRVTRHGGERHPGYKLGLLQLHIDLRLVVLQFSLSGGQKVEAFIKDWQSYPSDLELSVENLHGGQLGEASLLQFDASFLNLLYTGREGTQSPAGLLTMREICVTELKNIVCIHLHGKLGVVDDLPGVRQVEEDGVRRVLETKAVSADIPV